MKKTFSTGDIAKLCNVSVRTVQYYDKEGILGPSELSEGGRRIYSEEDLRKFRCICLYKALGFSLGEIKEVMNSENSYSLLDKIIANQLTKIDKEILALEKTRKQLSVISEEFRETGKVKVRSIEEMDTLVSKKNLHKKTDIMTYIFLACYLLLLFTGFPAAISIGGITPFIMVVITMVLLFGLIYYHSKVNSYVCPKCESKFSISFSRDMFSLNGGKNGKYLKCPNCKHKAWFKETYVD